MGLKHWMLPKDHFKTHLFFSIFGWGDPSKLGSWSEGCVKPLKLSREAIGQVSEDPYHAEFVSYRIIISFPFLVEDLADPLPLVDNSDFLFNPSQVTKLLMSFSKQLISPWVIFEYSEI